MVPLWRWNGQFSEAAAPAATLTWQGALRVLGSLRRRARQSLLLLQLRVEDGLPTPRISLAGA